MIDVLIERPYWDKELQVWVVNEIDNNRVFHEYHYDTENAAMEHYHLVLFGYEHN